jgi:hypothetical protein
VLVPIPLQDEADSLKELEMYWYDLCLAESGYCTVTAEAWEKTPWGRSTMHRLAWRQRGQRVDRRTARHVLGACRVESRSEFELVTCCVRVVEKCGNIVSPPAFCCCCRFQTSAISVRSPFDQLFGLFASSAHAQFHSATAQFHSKTEWATF